MSEVGESNSSLIRFLRGDVDAHPERSLFYTPEYIIRHSGDYWLENTHDYIQWCFPTPERSRWNPTAPLLTVDNLGIIMRSKEILNTLMRLKGRMMNFYMENTHWRIPVDHNHARITRIITSTRIIFGSPRAQEFLDVIEEYSKLNSTYRPNPQSQKLWRDAVKGPTDA